jgi:uncharacterized protein
MIAVEEMNNEQINEVLRRVGYGHLGLARGKYPYVVPIHYAFDDPYIYIYTTEGKKTEIIRANPEICLQVEQVKNDKNWQSVIVVGRAEHLRDETQRERALEFILAGNPTLTPAVSIRWLDHWVRENVEVIYRIKPRMITGRTTVDYGESSAVFAQQEKKRRTSIY